MLASGNSTRVAALTLLSVVCAEASRPPAARTVSSRAAPNSAPGLAARRRSKDGLRRRRDALSAARRPACGATQLARGKQRVALALHGARGALHARRTARDCRGLGCAAGTSASCARHHADAVDRARRDAQLAAGAQLGTTVCRSCCAPTIASTGHGGRHLAQPMHASSSIDARPSGGPPRRWRGRAAARRAQSRSKRRDGGSAARRALVELAAPAASAWA